MPESLATRVAPFPAGTSGERATPATLDEAARTVGVVLATEAPAHVWDWERGSVEEVLLMSGADFPAQVPFLDSHNRYSVENQLGSLRDLRVEGPELHATAFFSETGRAADAFVKVREGHLTDLSVGYAIDDAVWIPDGETAFVDGRTFTGPLRVVRKWRVKEGSLTPIGADEQAKIRSAAFPDDQPFTTEAAFMPGDKNKDSDEQTRATPPAPASTAAPHAEDKQAADAPADDAGAAARAAYAEMVSLGNRHGCPDFAERAIRDGMTLDAFRAALLDRISSEAERHAPAHTVSMGETDEAKFHRAARDSLLMRSSFGGSMKETAPGAAELRGYSLKELARECLRRSGLPAGGDMMEMVGRAFTSTSDFPAILADTAHKSVLAGAEEANETFGLWTGEATASDFKTHTGVSLDSFSSLDLVPEGAEYKYGQVSDRGVPYCVATYGKRFALTRQAVIDDNVNALTKIPSLMGRAAMRTVGNLVYSLLKENPQQFDGFALFCAEHKNLATSGGKPNVDTFGAGVTAMGTHTDSEGAPLNLRPAFLIVPIVLQAAAFQLLHAQVVGTQEQPNVPNPWAGYVVPVPEGRLDQESPRPWFMAAAKGFSIDVAWLGGNKTPRVEQRQGWSVDGTEYKVGIDAGAYVAEWRGLYKNPGN